MSSYKGYADAVSSGNYTSYLSQTTTNAIGSYSDCLDTANLSDSISSFPSGHSSLSFAGMTFATLVLLKMFRVSDFGTLGGMLCFSPLVLASYIAITRVQDYKHHEDDIMAGFIIGTASAVIIGYEYVHYIMQLRTKRLAKRDSTEDRLSNVSEDFNPKSNATNGPLSLAML